jgi:hypothetical protein
MNQDKIFRLYKRVQNRDRDAEKLLIAEHKKMYPQNHLHKHGQLVPGGCAEYRQNLHTVYLHLTR